MNAKTSASFLWPLLALPLCLSNCVSADVEDTEGVVDDGGLRDIPVIVNDCVDHDGDGFSGVGDICDSERPEFDCDEGDPRISPAGIEVCDGVDQDCDGLVDERVSNLCGGCTVLDEEPGQICGECGQVACDGLDSVRCEAGRGSACGGCEPLEAVPGEACAECGTYVCLDENTVGCDDPGRNGCGGCSAMPSDVGASCGECGETICAGPELMICDDSAANACGGCEELDSELGFACGECGIVGCDGTNGTGCDDPGINACGGCTVLDDVVGGPCGSCGVVACDGTDDTRCDESTMNACGGCDTLDGVIGDDCGDCGALACDGTEALSCQRDLGLNACGTCGELDGVPGESCGECAVWTCFWGIAVCPEDGPTSWYRDGDGDGWGVGSPQTACGPEGLFRATASGDCDDGDFSRNPGAAEVCNGVNDNCAAGIDEGTDTQLCGVGFYCESASCYPWPTLSVQDSSGGSCPDFSGADGPPDFRIHKVITGRPRAVARQTNRRVSCPGAPATPGAEFTLDGVGRFEETRPNEGITECSAVSPFLGRWESWIEIDGRESEHIFLNHRCSADPALARCADVADYCD